MKKFLKVFLIIVIILGAIAGTVFLFFRNYKESFDSAKSVIDYSYGEQAKTFKTDLNGVHATLTNESDSRFELIVLTYENVDDSILTLGNYLENYNNVDDEVIVKKLNELKNSQALAQSMINEFNRKRLASDYYDEKLGANDLYKQMCVVLTKSAELCKEINYQLGKTTLNKDADARFAMINLYADVVINSFANTKTASSLVEVNNAENINFINNYFGFTSEGLANLKNRHYSSANNNFIKVYNNCDSILLAKELKNRVATNSTYNASASNEAKAAYYFRTMYGIV